MDTLMAHRHGFGLQNIHALWACPGFFFLDTTDTVVVAAIEPEPSMSFLDVVLCLVDLYLPSWSRTRRSCVVE